MRPFATLVLVIGLSACGVSTEYQRDRLSDNAIDSVLKKPDVPDDTWPRVIYQKLLDRLPKEANARDLRTYLESIGAKCAEKKNEISCVYSTWMPKRTNHYFLSSRTSEGKFVRTDYFVTFKVAANQPIRGHLTVDIESRGGR